MSDRTMSRSWTIAALATAAGAAALAFGLFLAVGRDSVAGDEVKVLQSGDGSNVRVVKVIGDGDSVAVSDDDGGRGGYLGVDVREDTKSSEGGALVEHVVDGSPAEKAGLKDNDVIVGFGGDVVRGPGRLTEKIRGTKAGDKVVLDVRRDGKVQKLTVEMGERSKSLAWAWRGGDAGGLSLEQQRALEESLKGLDEKLPQLRENLGKMKFYGPGMHRMMVLGMDRPLLGIEMIETTPELREVLGGSKDAGVLVGKVLAGSAAERAGIKVGDLIVAVDGAKVADAGELAEAIRQHEGKTVELDTVRDKKPARVKVALPKLDEPEDEPTGPRASAWTLPRVLRALRSLSA